MKASAFIVPAFFIAGMHSTPRLPDTSGTIRSWPNTPGYHFPQFDKDNRAEDIGTNSPHCFLNSVAAMSEMIMPAANIFQTNH
jgi:hypothetical protein